MGASAGLKGDLRRRPGGEVLSGVWRWAEVSWGGARLNGTPSS